MNLVTEAQALELARLGSLYELCITIAGWIA